MVEIYCNLIKAGTKTIADVPDALRADVQQMLYPGQPLNETLIDAQKRLTNILAAYRYSKQQWFIYDGHQQRRDPYDEIRMDTVRDYLTVGKITSIPWAFSDTDIVTITDPQYFQNMKDTGYAWEMKLRSIEANVKQQIASATTLAQFDVVAVFEQLLTAVPS